MKRVLLVATALLVASPALAQQHEGHGGQPSVAAPAPAPEAADPHAGHNMSSMTDPAPTQGQPERHGEQEIPQPAPDPHAGHVMAAMPTDGMSEVGNASAPSPPLDHAADAFFDPEEMAQARSDLRKENGAFSGSMILFDLAEYQAREDGDGYRWEAEAWFGGDINRLLVKTEGEGTFGEPLESAELQLLYSRAIAPYWNAHVGLRQDFRPDPSRTYAVVGIEGIAPYWFHLSSQLFLSDRGDFRARAEGSFDERITQRLILSPRAEFNFSAQDIASIGVGSGLTDVELGLRLRYELDQKFAPYVGVEWARKFGDTARYARIAGENADVTNFVAGVRFWF